MKKIYLLLFTVFSLSVSTYAQTGWITKKLDDRLSVKFQTEPQKTTKNGADTYVDKAKDSIKYSAGVLDLKLLANLDSATLAPMKDDQGFADQMMGSMAAQKPNYTFGDVTIGEWKTHTTYSISGVENAKKGNLYIKMILIGSKMYAFSCFVPDALVTQNKDIFLNSIEDLRSH